MNRPTWVAAVAILVVGVAVAVLATGPADVEPRIAARTLAIRAGRPDLDVDIALAAAADPCGDIGVEDIVADPVAVEDLRAWYDAHRPLFGERSFEQAQVGLVGIVSLEQALASVRAERAKRGCPPRAETRSEERTVLGRGG